MMWFKTYFALYHLKKSFEYFAFIFNNNGFSFKKKLKYACIFFSLKKVKLVSHPPL